MNDHVLHESDITFGFLNRAVLSARRFNPRLITNEGRDTMLRAILKELGEADSFVFSVAFVTPGALASLKQALLQSSGRGRIVTSTYLGFNSPEAFAELLNLPNVDVFVVDDAAAGFHAKGYLFRRSGSSTAIIGSSNLTEAALQRNHEWNLKFSALADGDVVYQLEALVDRQVARAVPLTQAWVERYRASWRPPAPRNTVATVSDPHHVIVPNAMQSDALAQIDLIRSRGENRAIVVSATGTGKTILSALDVRACNPERMLFVVHREQILDKAISEFQRVLDAPRSDFRNQYSTVYGYKVDLATGTCPIFVTYHKHEDVEATVAYGDEFVDETTMRWFTRSRRTLASEEVRAITEHAVVPHVFVKRDDAEGTDFLYLGTARAQNPTQEQMPDGKGGQVPVVTMDLVFDQPIERGLFDYLTDDPVRVSKVDLSWEDGRRHVDVAPLDG